MSAENVRHRTCCAPMQSRIRLSGFVVELPLQPKTQRSTTEASEPNVEGAQEYTAITIDVGSYAQIFLASADALICKLCDFSRAVMHCRIEDPTTWALSLSIRLLCEPNRMSRPKQRRSFVHSLPCLTLASHRFAVLFSPPAASKEPPSRRTHSANFSSMSPDELHCMLHAYACHATGGSPGLRARPVEGISRASTQKEVRLNLSSRANAYIPRSHCE